ncbi:MAG: hypothetical protein Q9195_007422 [Heterodermia aff. obscurata]
MSLSNLFTLPFDVQWRKALVSLPRAVPDVALRFTSPEGPQPFVINLPSRGSYSIPVYVFIPIQIDQVKARNIPVIIDFHGGGFVLGSCLEQAPFCAKLARDLDAVVLTVDYRMGPANRHPAALHDAEDVVDAVLKPDAKGYKELRKAVANRVCQNKQHRSKPEVDLDKTRVAISGFSSGGNIALNLALSISPPQEDKEWPSRIPQDFPRRLPLLLFYPSLDCRQLPSERTRPPKLPVSKGLWAQTSDRLMPTYLPRDQSHQHRASPGLADVRNGLHPQAKMLLVLPELDSLAEQSEVWVKKVIAEGRGDDLVVENFENMKHGWTQMPPSWLSAEEKKTRLEAFEKAVAFTSSAWNG